MIDGKLKIPPKECSSNLCAFQFHLQTYYVMQCNLEQSKISFVKDIPLQSEFIEAVTLSIGGESISFILLLRGQRERVKKKIFQKKLKIRKFFLNRFSSKIFLKTNNPVTLFGSLLSNTLLKKDHFVLKVTITFI